MRRSEEFAVLDELRKTGPLPWELEERYQKLRRGQFFKAGLMCDRYLPSSPSRLNPEMSVADWLKARWTSADATVRHSLRLLADTLGIPLPLTRTQPTIPAKDSSPAQRSESGQQPNPPRPRPTDRPAEPGYHDPPEWDDDHADGWEPCTSLHDALHPEDRGWY